MSVKYLNVQGLVHQDESLCLERVIPFSDPPHTPWHAASLAQFVPLVWIS